MLLPLTIQQSPDYPSYIGGQAVIVDGIASLYVRFNDLRDAARAFSAVHNGRWKVDYVAPKVLDLAITPTDQLATVMYRASNYDSRIKVCVAFNPQNGELTSAFIIPAIKEQLMRFGDLKAIRSFAHTMAQIKVYDVEYYDIRDAERAVAEINRTGEIRIAVSDYRSVCLLHELTSSERRELDSTLQSRRYRHVGWPEPAPPCY